MLIARQVPPEWQESPLLSDEFPENIAVFGNRHFNKHLPPLVERLFGGNPRDYTDTEILTALRWETGKEWKLETIRGCCQSDWQQILYPADEWTDEAIDRFEVEYFNTGTAWEVWEAEELTSEPGEAEVMQVYCVEWTDDDHRAEIAEAMGGNPENVTLLKFKGWKRTPEWKEG